LVALGTEIESPQTGERLKFLSTAESSSGELFRAELTMQPGDYVVRSHVHPTQEERFVVLEGCWGWKRGRESGVADEGEAVAIPPGVPHRQWNAGDVPVRVRQEHRPALAAAEVFFETYYGLSRDGKLTKKGDPNTLQAAVLLPEVGGFIRPTSPPLFMQDPLFALLAAIARRRGYRARYPEYALPSARD
jgi:mannose-6-phosphate isomerase-like protein (cupin superfamily)